MSGFAAVFGKDQLGAVQLAVNDLKKNGTADITLAQADAGAAPSTALNAYRKVTSSNPIAVLGPIVGTFVSALLPDVAKEQIPLVTTASTPEDTGNKWLFRDFWSQSASVNAGAQYVTNDLHAKKVAVLADNTDFGQAFVKSLTPLLKKSGQSLVANESTPQTPLDLSGQVAKIKAANPDVTFVQLQTGSPLAQGVKALRDGGYQGTIFAAPGMTSPSTTKLLSNAEVQNVYAATMVLDTSKPNVQQFVKDYTALNGAAPDVYAANAYDTTMEIGQAIASGVKTPDQLRSYLSTTKYVGVATTYESDTEGNLGHTVDIVKFDANKVTNTVGQVTVSFSKPHA